MAWILDGPLASAQGPGPHQAIGAVGHRVVHGGARFTTAALITDEVIAEIQRLADLAPLHNPPNVTGILAARERLPGIPHVACFDTAFHTSIPEVAYLYALPYALYEKYGIRRYGFHGQSHSFVARRASELLGITASEFNCITCHLGNGCSMTAVRGGRSVDTSMGLTPLEGLIMGTRSGDFDPAILMYLADKGMDNAALNTLCNKESGLLGVSGISNDMRTLAKRAGERDPRAELAVQMFCYRIKKYLGAYLAVLGRTDAIVFTGGIGENSVMVRQLACTGLDSLGVIVDNERNERCPPQPTKISRDDSRVQVLVVPTDEEQAIADQTYELVAS
jgi:acetate kinase